MRVAVALTSRALEAADLESAQAHAPTARERRMHAGEAQAWGCGAEELDGGMDAGPGEAAGGGVGDAGEIGEVEALED